MNKSIMIVDDEQHFHELYTGMLESLNYEIISVYDGYEALTKIEDRRPDLIIIDLVLVMMPGDTLFLYIKSMPEYKDIPVIITNDIYLRSYKGLKKIDPKLVFLKKKSARN